MRPIDDVFQLAKSLTKNEKRFFKMYSQLTGGNKNYVKLFDVIEKEKVYDEQVIKKKLKGEKFLSNLPYEKNYLYKQLLKSLRIYHTESTVKSKARALADYAEILNQKGFPDQALKQVRLNEKGLTTFDDINMLIMACDQQEGIWNRMGSRIGPEDWEKLFDRRRSLLERSMNVNAYRQLERELLNMNAVELMKPGKKNQAKLARIKLHPLLNTQMKLDSFDVRFRYFMINALLALFEHDYRKEAHYFKEIMKLIDTVPEMKEAYYKEYYISTHYNYTVALLLARDFKAAQASISEFRKSSLTSSKSKNALAWFFLMNNESDLAMATGNVKKAQEVLEEMDQGIPVHAHCLSDTYVLPLYADRASLLFLTGDHKGSAALLTGLLNQYAGSEHRDKNTFIRLLLLINYFELKKFDLVEYVLGSTDRFLKKMDRSYKTENLMLGFFRKFVQKQSYSNAELQELRSKLDTVQKDKEEAASIYHFDYSSWVESKLRKTSFASVLSSKK